ncbi:glutamate ABC transporter substrate-binding protein [Streptomyces apocyni]|uniref:glutamate ABC transporter substrate-binding protein n=1 Tax=Streptomyces apocyni TaxID=2654677 RepID=UPI0012EA541D|nr:glutamate ABC transporter substrate-binding protein [Streptomyces apocyni]
MAVGCVLAVLFVLLPVRSGGPADGSVGRGGPGIADATHTKAEKCEEPERSLRPSADDGETVKDIKTRKDKPNKLIVGVDLNSFLWGFRNPSTGKLEGFDIDLVRAIAQDIMGDPDDVIFRAVPTNQRVPAIQSGQVDMIVRAMTITCDRAKDVAFSTAYFRTGQQLLVPDGSKITGYDGSLQGKKLCSASGSTALTELKKESHGADISTTVPNQLDCLVRLQLGEVDAVVTDSALAAGQAAQDPTVSLKGETFTEEYYGVAMHKEATDLVRRVNQVLEDYRKNGWQTSYKKWLADDLKDIDGPPPAKYVTD